MQPAVILSFRGIERSGALEDRAKKLGQRLYRFCGRITQCHIILEGQDHPTMAAATFTVKIDLAVPGAHIHADSLRLDGTGHRTIFPALRDAYNNARRQLRNLPPNRSVRVAGA